MVISIVVLGVVVLSRAQNNDLQQMEQSLYMKARLVQESIRGMTAGQIEGLDSRFESLQKENLTRISVFDVDGRILADSCSSEKLPDNSLYRPEIQQARERHMGVVMRYSDVDGEPMLFLALHNPSKQDAVAYIRVGIPVAILEEKLATLRLQVWTTIGITGGCGLLLAFWFSRRTIRPLLELTQSVERIAAGDYGRKIFAEGHSELGILARTFNFTSERLAAQFKQMDEDRQQLRAVLASMVEGVIAVDAQQQILFANERAGQLLEFDTRASVGRRLWEVVRRRPIQEVVNSALSDGKGHQKELSWNGSSHRSLMVHAGPLPGSPPRGAVLVLHDTTDLRRLESLRQEFVANVSHELKTPLSVIKASAETLIDYGAIDDPEARDLFMQRIADQAERLHALILDLLCLARIEAGSETYLFQPVLLHNVMEPCLKRCATLAEEKQQNLKTEPSLEPIAVWADEEAVVQIVDNLVDNAIKYTPAKGTITLRWWVNADSAYFEVEDTGLGIPEDQLPRIFERFYRVDKARSREMGGTGLGLSIVKHLVQAMQGTIQARSTLGKGSCFTVRLPLPPK